MLQDSQRSAGSTLALLPALIQTRRKKTVPLCHHQGVAGFCES